MNTDQLTGRPPTNPNNSYCSLNAENIPQLRIKPSQVLDLSNNRISSLTGLPSPEIIKYLQLSNNNIIKIEEKPLQFCKALTFLDMSFNTVQKIENLFYLHHLHTLNLSHNEISIVENLEGNANLKQLLLSDNKIHSIFIRSPLPRLVVLDLNGNKLKRLTGMTAFPCLSTLRIDRNLLTSLNGIQKLLNIRRISATSNNITNFSPFFLPLLSHLDLSMNKLTSLNPFINFQSLVRLEISGNGITDDGLGIEATFPELKELRMDGSRVSEISILAEIAPNLVVLSLAYSNITSVHQITLFVQGAKNLLYLDLRGNPVNSGCYPDLDGKAFGDQLTEYNSDEAYDDMYPDSIQIRQKYRNSVLSAASSQLIWFDGIQIPRSNISNQSSKLNFDFVDDAALNNSQDDQSIVYQDDIQQTDDIRKNVDAEFGIQCDLSTSSLFDDDLSNRVSKCEQTEPRRPQNIYYPNYQYPPTRKIFATDSSSTSSHGPNPVLPQVQQQFNYGDVSDDGSFVSTDSDPFGIGLNKMRVGIRKPRVEQDEPEYNEENNDFEPTDDEDDDEFDKYSACTDLDSSFVHFEIDPREHPGQRAHMKYCHRNCTTDQVDDDVQKMKGGCAFWVSVPKETKQKSTKQKAVIHSTNIPPFRNRPDMRRVPQNTGHWPFNTKSERRLPWEHELDKLPEPPRRKMATKRKTRTNTLKNKKT